MTQDTDRTPPPEPPGSRDFPIAHEPVKGKKPLPDALALLILGLLVLAFYRHTALSDRILPGVDAFTYFAPYRDYAAQVLRKGQLPLWNPYLFMGVPFIGNAQTAVFYPPNLLLALLPAALSGPRLITWSIVLHVALAAALAYLYARHVLRLTPLAALFGSSIFALGGFLSGQVEHVNQLNVSAWFPLLLLLWEKRPPDKPWKSESGSILIGVIVALGLLAGHTQSSYICLFGLGIYALLHALTSAWSTLRARSSWPSRGQTLLGALWPVVWSFALIALTAAGLSAVQLLPTVELSGLSIRSGGLAYREAVAFSLKPSPRLLRYTFLPPWGANLADVFGGDFFTEYLAYLGVIPIILLTGGSLAAIKTRVKAKTRTWAADLHTPQARLFILALLGLLLALGLYTPLYYLFFKLVPGFGLFRVPARWLFLYAFAAAMLSGLCLDRLTKELSHRWRVVISLLCTALTLVELFVTSQALPLAHPTLPQAFTSMRTATTHILAEQNKETIPGRVLSISDILFDPGDQADIEAILGDFADLRAIYDYIVCTKRKEVLAANLPLSQQIYAVDGYDGGVLPLARYVELQRLFLPEDQLSPDGRLRENLTGVPSARLLSLLGVEYILTDKVQDVWIDDVFYDLTFETILSLTSSRDLSIEPLTTTVAPSFQATALGIVAYTQGEEDAEAIAARVGIMAQDGSTRWLPLFARDLPAAGEPRSAVVLSWDQAVDVTEVVLELDKLSPELHIQGLTLIDERDGSTVPVLLTDQGQFKLVHSGDVKIYQVMDALPRAYVVHNAQVIQDDLTAIRAMADPAFDPAQTVILSSQTLDTLSPPQAASFAAKSWRGDKDERLTVHTYKPEHIVLEATLTQPGTLVLTDAAYPGWTATVDDQPVPILRANVHFRAINLPAGTHHVEWHYRPASFAWGAGISLATLTLTLIALSWLIFTKGK